MNEKAERKKVTEESTNRLSEWKRSKKEKKFYVFAYIESFRFSLKVKEQDARQASVLSSTFLSNHSFLTIHSELRFVRRDEN